ncbi:hypothetical protein NX014_21935, partial [Vibrio vulnificus]|uniref:hypothetical protein n=3 Tax=Vibrionaceae TaxID=641 RepID=UPI0028E09362
RHSPLNAALYPNVAVIGVCMQKVLKLDISIDYDEDLDLDDLKEIIAEAVIDNELEFTPRTGVLCAQADLRGSYIEESLLVEFVEFNSSDVFDSQGLILDSLSGTISVSFDYDAYYGCKDMDGGDQLEDSWTFELSGKILKFRLDIPEERYDEI